MRLHFEDAVLMAVSVVVLIVVFLASLETFGMANGFGLAYLAQILSVVAYLDWRHGREVAAKPWTRHQRGESE